MLRLRLCRVTLCLIGFAFGDIVGSVSDEVASVQRYDVPSAQHLEEYRDTAAYQAQVFLAHYGGDCKHTVEM